MASGGDAVSLKVVAQWFRDEDGAVDLLVGFDDGHKEACQGHPAAVQHVRQLIAALLCLEAQFHAAGLKVLGIRNAADLKVAPLSRCPDLDVIGPCSTEADIAGAQLDCTEMQLEGLEDGLGVPGQ